MEPVLVLGGTGFVGRHLCEKLVRAGYPVTVATRAGTQTSPLRCLPRLNLVQADIHDAPVLGDLVAGHRLVVNLVAILHGDQARFDAVHVTLPGQLARACHASAVRRLVHVSALGADPAGPSMYQRSKGRGEQLLREALAGSATDLCIVRPSVIFGAQDRLLNLFARLQAWLPVLPLAGAGCRFQPVWVEDVAEAIVRCLSAPTPPAPVIEAAGPDVMTLRELVTLAATASGKPAAHILPLPDTLARWQARVMELAPGEPLMSRDNLASMAVDNIASGQFPGLAALGITPASVAAVAPGYLGQRGPRSGLDGLRRGAGR
jgi:uncharacterized protein YbjT (DUF2867 family)